MIATEAEIEVYDLGWSAEDLGRSAASNPSIKAYF